MTDIKELADLKENLKDEAGWILEIQNNICGQINQILWLAGYLQGEFRNTEADTKARKWAWYNDVGVGIHFSNPKYHNMVAVRGVPVPGEETPEAAMVLPVDNHTDAEVTRNISREVKISTNARVAETNSFDFSVTAGVEAGVSGTEGNFGANFKASLQTHFGMNFVSEWAKEKGNEVTRTVSDTVTLKPQSSYNIAVTVDRIEMEQEIKVSGILDFQILIKTPNWADSSSAYHNGGKQRFKSHHTFEADDMKALARQFIGMSGFVFANEDRKKLLLTEKDYALQIGHFLSEDYRRVETVTKMRYNEAGMSTLVLVRKELPKGKK